MYGKNTTTGQCDQVLLLSWFEFRSLTALMASWLHVCFIAARSRQCRRQQHSTRPPTRPRRPATTGRRQRRRRPRLPRRRRTASGCSRRRRRRLLAWRTRSSCLLSRRNCIISTLWLNCRPTVPSASLPTQGWVCCCFSRDLSSLVIIVSKKLSENSSGCIVQFYCRWLSIIAIGIIGLQFKSCYPNQRFSVLSAIAE